LSNENIEAPEGAALFFDQQIFMVNNLKAKKGLELKRVIHHKLKLLGIKLHKKVILIFETGLGTLQGFMKLPTTLHHTFSLQQN
jgi:hypothetical protein